MTESEEVKIWESLPTSALIKLQNLARKNYQESRPNKKDFWKSKVKRIGKIIYSRK